MAGEYRGTEALTPRRRRPAPAAEERRRPGAMLGILALAVAIATGVLVWIGITSAMDGRFALGTTLAYCATGTSVVAVLGGICALVLDRGRAWGVIAIVLGLAADPLILTKVLGLVGGLG